MCFSFSSLYSIIRLHLPYFFPIFFPKFLTFIAFHLSIVCHANGQTRGSIVRYQLPVFRNPCRLWQFTPFAFLYQLRPCPSRFITQLMDSSCYCSAATNSPSRIDTSRCLLSSRKTITWLGIRPPRCHSPLPSSGHAVRRFRF
ncbi:hypothetical protein N657DRAFT_41869 [Parathielavia appendiculata]|uniref:Uncharacterized protein n=1 Tax=Parathielavia appendiculata TaxID=2587402 RepID=A0AAN6Z8E9_9PEZI|nr:hypothetical protein N657DRAFT_41869 [Parathielavia appendiculata]